MRFWLPPVMRTPAPLLLWITLPTVLLPVPASIYTPCPPLWEMILPALTSEPPMELLAGASVPTFFTVALSR